MSKHKFVKKINREPYFYQLCATKALFSLKLSFLHYSKKGKSFFTHFLEMANPRKFSHPTTPFIENAQPEGWAFSMVGCEGLEPPTFSV